jgi:hypothetical protein
MFMGKVNAGVLSSGFSPQVECQFVRDTSSNFIGAPLTNQDIQPPLGCQDCTNLQYCSDFKQPNQLEPLSSIGLDLDKIYRITGDGDTSYIDNFNETPPLSSEFKPPLGCQASILPDIEDILTPNTGWITYDPVVFDGAGDIISNVTDQGFKGVSFLDTDCLPCRSSAITLSGKCGTYLFRIKFKKRLLTGRDILDTIKSSIKNKFISVKINGVNVKDYQTNKILLSKNTSIVITPLGVGGSRFSISNKQPSAASVIDSDFEDNPMPDPPPLKLRSDNLGHVSKHNFGVTTDITASSFGYGDTLDIPANPITLSGDLVPQTESLVGGRLHVSGYFLDSTALLSYVQLILPDAFCGFAVGGTRVVYPTYLLCAELEPVALGVGGKKKVKPGVGTKTNTRGNGNVVIKGKGDYKSVVKQVTANLKPAVKKALMAGGRALGTSIHPMLGDTGSRIAAKLSKLIGSGDYSSGDAMSNEPPVLNSLFPDKSSLGNAYAQFGNQADATVVMHRSLVQDITSGPVAGLFSNTVIPVNAGLAVFDPFCSSIAQNFEIYKFAGLCFTYISSCSEYITGTALGTVIMAMEYNSASAPFTNKTQMENSDFAISCRLDHDMVYGVECKNQPMDGYLVRNSNLSLPAPLTDMGLFQIAVAPSTTVPINTVLGELWVSYHVLLRRPKLTPARFGYAHFRFTYAVVTTSAVYSFGTLNPIYSPIIYGSLTNCYVNTPNSNVIFFPYAEVGDTYLVTMVWYFPGVVTLTSYGSVILSNLAGMTAYNNNSTYYTNCTGTFGNYVTFTAMVTVNSIATIPSFGFSGITATNSSAGVVNMDLIVTDLGNGFNLSTL